MTEMEMFTKAVVFASQKHREQTRKDGKTPYFYHLMAVAEIVKDAGYDIKTQITAFLHDTLEDTDATESEILEFGPDVLEAVKLLTREEGIDESQYVAGILANKMATAVKNADKMHNVYEASYCNDKTWGRKYIEKAEKYYSGKFTRALDGVIAAAKTTCGGCKSRRGPILYDPEAMTLYSDVKANT